MKCNLCLVLKDAGYRYKKRPKRHEQAKAIHLCIESVWAGTASM
jgi:hypothetical protein